MTNWEPILMAGLGAAAAQIDLGLAPASMLILCLKAFIGAAVGAYFGNHVASRKNKA